ncbi:MAG: Na+/H+ antiporter subunit G [Burkholderiales bacterium]|nr:MAG: Na+/H+ antiporter subunit G [Burkholderiales bacterium]
MPFTVDLLASLLLVAGGAFALVGAIGLARLRDFYLRVHAPTKASTLGVGGALLASMLVFGWTGQRVVIHELLITVFVFVTAPIAAHLLVKSALERDPARRPPEPGTAPDAPPAESSPTPPPTPPA